MCAMWNLRWFVKRHRGSSSQRPRWLPCTVRVYSLNFREVHFAASVLYVSLGTELRMERQHWPVEAYVIHRANSRGSEFEGINTIWILKLRPQLMAGSGTKTRSHLKVNFLCYGERISAVMHNHRFCCNFFVLIYDFAHCIFIKFRFKNYIGFKQLRHSTRRHFGACFLTISKS